MTPKESILRVSKITKDPRTVPACAHHVATHEGIPVRHGRGRKLIYGAVSLCGCSGLPAERSSLIPVLVLGTALCHKTAGSAAGGGLCGIPVWHGRGRRLIQSAVRLCGCSGLPAGSGSLIPALALGTALCHRAASPAASGILCGIPAEAIYSVSILSSLQRSSAG